LSGSERGERWPFAAEHDASIPAKSARFVRRPFLGVAAGWSVLMACAHSLDSVVEMRNCR